MNKEEILKGKAQIKNKWFETKEDELDIALNVIDDLLVYINQLEKNRDEVINKIYNTHFMTSRMTGKTLFYKFLKELAELLERGE